MLGSLTHELSVEVNWYDTALITPLVGQKGWDIPGTMHVWLGYSQTSNNICINHNKSEYVLCESICQINGLFDNPSQSCYFIILLYW